MKLKYLLAIIIFFFTLAVFPSILVSSQVIARGTFDCRLLPGTTGGCDIGPVNCDPGCFPTGDCTGVAGSECNSTTFSCECPGGTTCDDLEGRCSFTAFCANGDPIDADDCNFPGFLCCPEEVAPGQSCEADLGGRCVFTGTCANGPPINSDDCNLPATLCCPTSPAYAPAPVAVYCNDSGNATTTQTGRLYTAIGCVPIGDVNQFLEFILPWAIGLAGGIALILIVYAGFLIITSAGNPQKLQAGKELLTAAAMGLLLLIFSAFILQFVGITILNIPGL